MILSRLATAVACVPAIEDSSRMTPSTRTRTNSRRCCGVKWMSEAPRSSAFEIARLMKTTAGVSWLRSRTFASSSVSAASVTTSSIVDRGLVVERRDRGLDRVGCRDADAHRHAEREPELVGEHDVGRVGDRDEHVAVVEEADRQRPVAAGQASGSSSAASISIDGRSSSTNSSSCCSARTREIASRRDEALARAGSRRGAAPASDASRRERSRAAPVSPLRRARAASRARATVGSWQLPCFAYRQQGSPG